MLTFEFARDADALRKINPAQIHDMYRGAGPGLSYKQQQQGQLKESILLTMPVLAKSKTSWKNRATTLQMPTPLTMSDLGYPGMTFAYAV
jgi:hypothetical protein